jgi:hypothetical protein
MFRLGKGQIPRDKAPRMPLNFRQRQFHESALESAGPAGSHAIQFLRREHAQWRALSLSPGQILVCHGQRPGAQNDQKCALDLPN